MGAQQRNAELLERYCAGEEEVFDLLITENMGLVKRVALRFCGRGIEYEDLLQIGTIGMMKAVRSFDCSYGTAFSTYAVPLIIGELRKNLREEGAVKVSRSIKSLGSRILHEQECFCREYGRQPRPKELAQRCQISEEELVYALEAVSPIRSFEDPVGEEEGMTLGSILCNKEDEMERLTEQIALKEAIATLTPTQREILQMRYERELSQEQTGRLLGMTQVKVSREEKKIMQLLRAQLQPS